MGEERVYAIDGGVDLALRPGENLPAARCDDIRILPGHAFERMG